MAKQIYAPQDGLQLNKRQFWFTSVDWFGLYMVKLGSLREKNWGNMFKCLTSRCIHLDLMPNMDIGSFLLAIHSFIACRGKLYELLSDRSTNFCDGEKELQQDFEAAGQTVHPVQI